MKRPEVVHADALDWLSSYDGDPFDAVVTDPPYGIAFRPPGVGDDTSHWDRFESNAAFRAWTTEWAGALLRVVKPGAHAAVSALPKMLGHVQVAFEDAGWETRDCICWGFTRAMPKSLNLSGEMVLTGPEPNTGRCECGNYDAPAKMYDMRQGNRSTNCSNCGGAPPPALTNGWGTGLKPAWEPILLLRAPLAGTVQRTFDAHGTGAINIAAARIPLVGESAGMKSVRENRCACEEPRAKKTDGLFQTFGLCDICGRFIRPVLEDGIARWPANLAFDEEAAELVDAAHGVAGDDEKRKTRFFFIAKASTAEREEGLGGVERRNEHPTVKPIELGRWLTRLIAGEGARVLDPFAGSGSYGIAAWKERCEWTGVEREESYVEIARQRIAHWCAQGVLL